MINGQLNMVSVPAAAPPGTLESALQVAVTMDDVPQKGGGFAELLSGIRLQAKETVLPDSGESEAFQSNDPLAPGGDVIELLAQLNVASRINPASETDVQKPEESEKKRVSADAVLPCSEQSDVTSQTVLAAYSQPGRMPEVNIPAPLPADMLQNVAATELTAENPSTEHFVNPAVIQQQNNQPESVRPSTAGNQSFRTAADTEPLLKTGEGTLLIQSPPPVSATAPQPLQSDRMSEVNIPTPISVDRLQNVAAAIEQPGVTAAATAATGTVQAATESILAEQAPLLKPSVAIYEKPVVTPVGETSQNHPETPQAAAVDKQPAANMAAAVQASDEIVIRQLPANEDMPVASAEKQGLSSGRSADHRMTAPAPVSAQESETEMQFFQSRPITAMTASASVAVANRSAGPDRPQPVSEPHIEKVRAGNEKSVVKETTSSLQLSVANDEVMVGTDAPGYGEMSQGQSDSASDNELLAQNMRGQLNSENQKNPAVTGKSVPTEPVREDVPGQQVMPRLKECLAQHGVKPGNQQITLTLSPDSLGELKMSLNLQGQKLSVEILTENRSVRDLIVQHTDALKESLARQNITMESFDVTTGGKGSGNQGQNQSAWRELAKQQQQQQFWTSPRGYQTAQADLSPGQTGYRRQQGQSMLDIHY